ncbi:MAG: hypothetical protein WC184_10910 [Acidimicrobiia bacterium]
MARPLTGSIKKQNGRWVASVPAERGSRRRVSTSWLDEKAARFWLATQVERLNAGLPAQRASTEGRVSRRTVGQAPVSSPPESPASLEPRADHADGQRPVRLAEVGARWHREHYALLHGADAERTKDVLGILNRHLIPAFDDLLTLDLETGRAKVIAWVRMMAGYPAEPGGAPPTGRTYAKKVVGNYLWILTEVLNHAQLLGVDITLVGTGPQATSGLTFGVKAMAPKGRPKRKPYLVTLNATAGIASEMHVIHQLVLWLMRIAGLRIGEAYGLVVANFGEKDGWGHLLIEAQGGKNYLVRDSDEDIVKTTRKEAVKTESGFRLIALPHALTALIRLIIVAFHTDPITGEVDFDARLVPTIRSEGGGRAGFESSLRDASTGVTGASGAVDDYVIPHDMRKGYATDLAWSDDVDGVVKRRSMGHRAGSDVFDLVYTLDDRLKEAMRPAAEKMQAEITGTIGSLIVPTAKRPSYAADHCRTRQAAIDAVLAEAGWQDDATNGTRVTTEEAATHLGMAVSATRRLFPDQIPAVKVDGCWLARLDDVIAYRERHDGYTTLAEVAEVAGTDYHAVHRMLGILKITAHKDDYTRGLLLTDEQARQLISEFARIDRLEKRSVTAAVAAGMLRCAHSTVGEWVKSGRLIEDPESDTSGARYVTRSSINAELERRGTPKQTVVTAAELKEYADLDDTGIRALAKKGVFVRGPKGGYTVDSVRAWILGYRPDLIDSNLVPPV